MNTKIGKDSQDKISYFEKLSVEMIRRFKKDNITKKDIKEAIRLARSNRL